MKTFAISTILAVVTSSAIAVVSAQPVSDEPAQALPSHAECSLFGPSGPELQMSGLAAEARNRYLRSRLTQEVVSRLGSAQQADTVAGQVDAASNPGLIDQYLFGAMNANNVTPAPPSNDYEFIRRVTLDLTGRVVAFDRLQQFVTDSAPDKRAKYIEELLSSPEYVDKWTMFFGDLLKNNTDNTQVRRYAEGRNAFYAYIKSAVQNNKPYNVMVTEMLAGAGTNSWQQGELNWNIGGQVTGGPRTGQDNFDQMAANAAEKFLGIAHFNCLLCHDGRRHLDTLSVWGKTATRMNAWEMAAFFSRITFRRVAATSVPGGPAYWEVSDNARTADYPLNTATGNRPNRQPVGALRNVTPRYPFAGDFKAAGSDNYRAVLAQAITSDIQFSRAAVNYVWKQFFARGIVEPVNQFDLARLDSKNPPPAPWTLQPTNADMLNALAADFQQSNYDIKQLIRNIANSRAYQLSARYDGEWKPDYEKYFARKFVRRLWAEEIVDAVAQTSRIGQSYNVTGLGTINWTMQLPETANVPGGQMTSFLDSFLRGNRVDEDRRDDGAIPQVLNLMNDSYVVTRSRASGNGATASLARALIMKYPSGNDQLLVNEMFLTVLNRPATGEEGRIATSALAQGASAAERQQKIEDLLWSLYNKVDFIFNY